MHFLDNPSNFQDCMNMLSHQRFIKGWLSFTQLWRYRKRVLSPPTFQISKDRTKWWYFSTAVGYLDRLQLNCFIQSSICQVFIGRMIVDSVSVALFPKTLTAITSNMAEKGTTGTTHQCFYLSLKLWEDYRKITPPKAYVDGVGTISPVRSENFYDPLETRSKVTNSRTCCLGKWG